MINNPSHYGGADNPYEAIKIIEALGLNFNLGNTLKYIARAGKKDEVIQELKKAAWYLNREISNLEVQDAILPNKEGSGIEIFEGYYIKANSPEEYKTLYKYLFGVELHPDEGDGLYFHCVNAEGDYEIHSEPLKGYSNLPFNTWKKMVYNEQ